MELRARLKAGIDGNPWHDDIDMWLSRDEWSAQRAAQKQAWKDGLTDAEKRFGASVSRAVTRSWSMAFVLADVVDKGLYRGYAETFEAKSTTWKKEHVCAKLKDNPYAYQGDIATECNPAILLCWAKERLGLCKSAVYSMIDVVETFSTDGQVHADALPYRFGHLVEMLPLTAEQRKQVKPYWTVKEIRAYVKQCKSEKNKNDSQLFQTSGMENDDESDGTENEPAPKDKYARWAKWTKNELCDRILELEENERRMLATIDSLTGELESYKHGKKRRKAVDITEADLDSLDGLAE